MSRKVVLSTRDAIKAVFALLSRRCSVALSGHQGALPCMCKLHLICYALYELRCSSISSRFKISANSNHSNFRKPDDYVEVYIHCFNQRWRIFQNAQQDCNAIGSHDESAFNSSCNSSNLCKNTTRASSSLFSRSIVAVGIGVFRRRLFR